MRFLLFCQNPYAIGIMDPLAGEISARAYDILWYIPDSMAGSWNNNSNYAVTNSITDCYRYNPDIIFVPGNEVPHYLRGLKVQIFHGFAGEKKGHFRIRHYFDLYLTQGPWFTERFNKLSAKQGNFRVAETGWCKLDPFYAALRNKSVIGNDKEDKNNNKVLYAPTFSPSLTSADAALDSIIELSRVSGIELTVKFHDLTSSLIIERYREASLTNESIVISTEKNLLPLMQQSDLMISDTSSAVYEFLLMDRPVITINSRSENIRWENIPDPTGLKEKVIFNLENDPYSDDRAWISQNYHPYSDGKSSSRMIDAALAYISEHGIPGRRKLPPGRRIKINRMFGKESSHVQ